MAEKQGLAMTAFDAREIVAKGELGSELELERAVQVGRLLRLMGKDQPELEALRKEVRNLIIRYESQHWSDVDLVTEEQMKESALAESQVDRERLFFRKRKELIIQQLKQNALNQNDLSLILDHSKSYTSELLNGVRAFSMSDLVIIHKLFGIELGDLIYTEIPAETEKRFQESLQNAAKKQTRNTSRLAALTKSLEGAL